MTRGKRAYEDVEDTNDVQEWSGRERCSHRGVRVLPKKTKVSIAPRTESPQAGASASGHGGSSTARNPPHLPDGGGNVASSDGDEHFLHEWMGREAFVHCQGKVWLLSNENPNMLNVSLSLSTTFNKNFLKFGTSILNARCSLKRHLKTA